MAWKSCEKTPSSSEQKFQCNCQSYWNQSFFREIDRLLFSVLDSAPDPPPSISAPATSAIWPIASMTAACSKARAMISRSIFYLHFAATAPYWGCLSEQTSGHSFEMTDEFPMRFWPSSNYISSAILLYSYSSSFSSFKCKCYWTLWLHFRVAVFSFSEECSFRPAVLFSFQVRRFFCLLILQSFCTIQSPFLLYPNCPVYPQWSATGC